MLKSTLNPKITKLILENNPVGRKRTALWFFEKELREQWVGNAERGGSESQISENLKVNRKLRKSDIRELWHKMNPESKRKYFNLAEFDEYRYAEQRALWIAKVGSLLAKGGDAIDKLSESLLNQSTIKEELLEIERHHKNYERMIQAQSTKMLYKSLVDKTEVENSDLNISDLISAVPENYRPILSRPRRPPCAFVLYSSDNKERLNNIRKEKYPQLSFLKAAAIEWEKASQGERLVYEEKYVKLVGEYKEEMEEFKRKNFNSDDSYLEQAAKERTAYRKSLRRRLRGYSVIPVNVRNAFNFFLMDNKDVPLTDLTQVWRGLSEEEKEKYKKLNEHDVARYYSQKTAHIGLMKKLNELFNKSQSMSAKKDIN